MRERFDAAPLPSEKVPQHDPRACRNPSLTKTFHTTAIFANPPRTVGQDDPRRPTQAGRHNRLRANETPAWGAGQPPAIAGTESQIMMEGRPGNAPNTRDWLHHGTTACSGFAPYLPSAPA
jgi:hypothetical protein